MGILGIFQAARQCVLLSRDGNEMNVIGHQAIASQCHPVPLHALMEQAKVNAPLGIPFQDGAPSIAGLRDVMGNAWRNHPANRTIGLPGHGVFVSEREWRLQAHFSPPANVRTMIK